MGRRANGEGTIYLRKSDGRYCAAVVVNGKRRVLYGRTRAEVQRKLHDLVTAQQDGITVPGQRETVASFFMTWLDDAKPTIRLRTWERYEQLVRVHIIPALGKVPLARLEPLMIQRFYSRLITGGLSPTTAHQVHAVVHRALSRAVRWGVAARNPAAMVDAPRVHRHEMRVLSAEEVRRMLDASRGTRWGPLLTMAVTTGMRQGELLALRWRDADLGRATVSVNATAQRTRGEGMVVAEPKTAKSRRQIALSAGAVTALEGQRKSQAEDRLCAEEWADLDLIFPNRAGRYQETSRLNAEFHEVLRAAGLPRIRFHDLRHTAATLMLSRGVHPKIASEMLGHSTVGMTLDLYSHVSETMQREAADTIDLLLFEPDVATSGAT